MVCPWSKAVFPSVMALLKASRHLATDLGSKGFLIPSAGVGPEPEAVGSGEEDREPGGERRGAEADTTAVSVEAAGGRGAGKESAPGGAQGHGGGSPVCLVMSDA